MRGGARSTLKHATCFVSIDRLADTHKASRKTQGRMFQIASVPLSQVAHKLYMFERAKKTQVSDSYKRRSK